MHTLALTIFWILFILVCLIIGISMAFEVFITKPKCFKTEETIAIEKSKDLWGDYDKYPKEEWNISGYGGYLLHGTWIKNSGKKFVIITHGYTYTRFGGVKYANLFYRLGYNIYLYDIRHHGQNTSTYCSMGRYESRDISYIARAIYARFGDDCKIGMHGESLGAASSLLALEDNQKMLFLIADCGFSSLGQLMEYQASNRFHLPFFLARTSSFMNILIHHFSFYKVQPIEALRSNKVPVLFIHGAEDTFIPSTMSSAMFNATPSKKQIFLFPNADHAQSYTSDPKRYEEAVRNFVHACEKDF